MKVKFPSSLGGHVLGVGAIAEAHLYDSTTQIWTYLGDMPGGPRYSHACGTFTNAEGHLGAVMAGGYGSTGYVVDIYNFETGQWKSSGESTKNTM